MFWIAENRKDVVEKTKWVLQPKDFIGFHLTDKAISDPWPTKGICNVVTRLSIDTLLKRIGWSSSVMPELRDGFQTRGDLTESAAKVFGFPRAGIPVSTGCDKTHLICSRNGARASFDKCSRKRWPSCERCGALGDG